MCCVWPVCARGIYSSVCMDGWMCELVDSLSTLFCFWLSSFLSIFFSSFFFAQQSGLKSRPLVCTVDFAYENLTLIRSTLFMLHIPFNFPVISSFYFQPTYSCSELSSNSLIFFLSLPLCLSLCVCVYIYRRQTCSLSVS